MKERQMMKSRMLLRLEKTNNKEIMEKDLERYKKDFNIA